MTVKELIERLREFPEDWPVVYGLFSEHRVLERDDIQPARLQPARPDGWVHDRWRDVDGWPSVPTVEYVVLPGN